MKKFVIGMVMASVAIPANAAEYKYTPVALIEGEVTFNRGTPVVNRDMSFDENSGVLIRLMPITDEGRPAFNVLVQNYTDKPFNFGLENVAVMIGGQSVRVYDSATLIKKAKEAQMWGALAAGLVAGLASTSYGSTTLHTPRGTYRSHSTYSNPYVAASLSQQYSAALREDFNSRMDEISDVIDTTTIQPGESYGGRIVMEKYKAKQWPADMQVTFTINGNPTTIDYKVVKK